MSPEVFWMSPDDGPSGSGYADPVCVAQVTVATGELSAVIDGDRNSSSFNFSLWLGARS